ncbi:acidic proline-rich protein PRP33-like isoform X2 [Anoplopoma fimbria]|nr:acidic proline-rich protein PRP33-like isoform X2 [Anoplopoma fimbria]
MRRSWSHGNRWTTAWRKTRWTSSTATASQWRILRLLFQPLRLRPQDSSTNHTSDSFTSGSDRLLLCEASSSSSSSSLHHHLLLPAHPLLHTRCGPASDGSGPAPLPDTDGERDVPPPGGPRYTPRRAYPPHHTGLPGDEPRHSSAAEPSAGSDGPASHPDPVTVAGSAGPAQRGRVPGPPGPGGPNQTRPCPLTMLHPAWLRLHRHAAAHHADHPHRHAGPR